jgi:TetR/AcrR family fatty acid metabolism transcriptional regulator
MKEYANPKFADFLRLLTGIIAEGQRAGTIEPSLPAPLAARTLFGALDELALYWVLGRGEKFDIVRAAVWVGVMFLQGLERRRTP